MKKLNQKGFTLIELLAVIVILAILVAVAVPAVTRYLGSARKSTYALNAKEAIEAVRGEILSKGYTNDVYYALDDINVLMEKKLDKSSYGAPYTKDSYVAVRFDENGQATYSICLTDGNNGYGSNDSAVLEADISEENLYTGRAGSKCTAPTDISRIQ